MRSESGDETRPDPVRRAEATEVSSEPPTVGCVRPLWGETEAEAVLPTPQQPVEVDGEPEPARPPASRRATTRPAAPPAATSTAGGTGHLLTAGGFRNG